MPDYDIGKAFARIEKELMASMIRNMERHKAEELKEGYEWAQWQVEQLRALEQYRKRNRKKFLKRFREINDWIPHLIEEARKDGQMDQEVKILEALKKGFKARKGSGDIEGAFFEVNDRKLNALIKATTDDFKRAEIAILRRSEDQYRKIIFDAQVYANAGGTTYEKAVDMAAKDFISKGIDCIEYANGARHTLSDYADMAIRTATKRAYLTGEGEKRKEWGIATVIVNKRGNPCPKCAPFCGKVLIDDVWSGGSRKDGPYPLMSTAIAYGLYHPRCKDVHTTYFPGISTADDTWTEEELRNIGANYEADQKQQHAKRQAEKYDRLSELSLDPGNKQKYGARADRWQREAIKPQRRANSSNDPFERMFYDRQAQTMGEISQNKDLQNIFRGARYKEGVQPKRFEDITGNWFPDAIPESHPVVKLSKLAKDGVEYIVDNFHVVMKPSQNEIRVAELLRKKIGGEIFIVPKVNKPDGIKTSDFMFNGYGYDLKTITGCGNSTLRDAVKRKKGQSRRFIFDLSDSKLTLTDVERQMHGMFSDYHTAFVEEVVIIRGDEIQKVFRRKKKNQPSALSS